MRFFIGAIVSTLILSPISVLSLATGSESTNIVAKVNSGPSRAEVAELKQPLASDSTLDKRMCFRRGCNKKSKRRYGFQCKKKYFSPKKIERARAAACPKIKENNQGSSFPAIYTASDFKIEGPYLEWPINRNGRFYNKWRRGRYRVILTKQCIVVGVVIREKKSSYSTCTNLSEDEDDDKHDDKHDVSDSDSDDDDDDDDDDDE